MCSFIDPEKTPTQERQRDGGRILDDPDEPFHFIPVEKGFSFMRYLESIFGNEKFEKFFKGNTTHIFNLRIFIAHAFNWLRLKRIFNTFHTRQLQLKIGKAFYILILILKKKNWIKSIGIYGLINQVLLQSRENMIRPYKMFAQR